jgi:hypothetical protein
MNDKRITRLLRESMTVEDLMRALESCDPKSYVIFGNTQNPGQMEGFRVENCEEIPASMVRGIGHNLADLCEIRIVEDEEVQGTGSVVVLQ